MSINPDTLVENDFLKNVPSPKPPSPNNKSAPHEFFGNSAGGFSGANSPIFCPYRKKAGTRSNIKNTLFICITKVERINHFSIIATAKFISLALVFISNLE